MDEQRDRTGRRRFLLILGGPLLLVGAGAGVASALWSGGEPDPLRVRTDAEPLNARFRMYLGELSDAHWQGYDIDEPPGDRSIPSPDSRIRLVGIARLQPGAAAGILGDPQHSFEATALTALPDRLRPYAPAGASWQRSPGFNAHANQPGSSGYASGEFAFDASRELVSFDVVFLYT